MRQINSHFFFFFFLFIQRKQLIFFEFYQRKKNVANNLFFDAWKYELLHTQKKNNLWIFFISELWNIVHWHFLNFFFLLHSIMLICCNCELFGDKSKENFCLFESGEKNFYLEINLKRLESGKLFTLPIQKFYLQSLFRELMAEWPSVYLQHGLSGEWSIAVSRSTHDLKLILSRDTFHTNS